MKYAAKAIDYYNIGEVKGCFKNRKRVGKWIWFYKNGNKRFEGNYKDGQKTGEWIYYHENGMIGEKSLYKCGHKID